MVRAIMVETAAEARELNAFFDAEREALVPPDLLDHRTSALEVSRITLARYDPSLKGGLSCCSAIGPLIG